MSVYFGNDAIKEIDSYGVYVGGINSNCITEIPQDIKMELDLATVTYTGSLGVYDNIVSGFSSTSWLTVPTAFAPSSNNWEICIKFKPTSIGVRQDLFNSYDYAYQPLDIFITTDGRLSTGGYINGSTTVLFSITGNTVISANVEYWVKVEYNNASGYALKLSTDGINFTTEATSSVTTALTQPFTIALGADFAADGAYYQGAFSGSIYLKDSYINVNGSRWWTGNAGTLTLKAGSKLYKAGGETVTVPVDATLCFNLGTFNNLITTYEPQNHNIGIYQQGVNAVSAATAPSTGHNDTVWFDTTNNAFKVTHNNGVSWEEIPLPIGVCTTTTSSSVTSITHIFNGCGYIGKSYFILPGIVAKRPNGLDASGTNIVETVTNDRVLTFPYDYMPINQQVFLCVSGGQVVERRNANYYSQSTQPTIAAYSVWYNTADNRMYYIGQDTSPGYQVDNSLVTPIITSISTDSSYNITSFTPAVQQSDAIFSKIGAIYNGSDLVYQYQPYTPGTVLLNTASSGTYSVNLKRGRYYISLTGAGGRANGGYYYACFQNSGGAGGTVKGDFWVNEDTTVTVVVGYGQDAEGTPSTLTCNGVQMMWADGGKWCHANGSCGGNVGGAASFSLSGALVNKSLGNYTGNAGQYSTGTAYGGLSQDGIDTQRGRGANSNSCNHVYGNAGGAYIKYVSMQQ